MLLRAILLLTVLSGFSCGHVLTSHVCDTNIDNIGDSPEFICGSDLKIYPNLHLLEMPLSMCYPQPQGEPESLTYEIGLSMLSIPQNPQQKTWIQNLNQRNIRHPISNRLRENPYLNRRLPAHYYGRNLRGSLRNSIFPSNYDRHGIRAPNSAHVYQDKGLPRAGQQYQDKRFQNPMRHHHSQFKPPLHPPKDHKKHNFMRPYIHPRFLENALNLMPFPTQLPIVDQFDNFQNLVPSGATETCDDELTPDDSVPELKKTGRKVPDATKPAKPKGGKPASKAKAPKKPSKGNQGKHLNEESKKAEEGSPEALRQAVEERSGLKVFQNLSKNVTKNTDSDDKKGVSSKSDDEIKSDDKNESSKGTDEKPGSSVDQNSKKESDQDQEQDAAADAKSDDSRSVSTDEKKNDGAATER
ncbi:hypothetical protein C0J52_14295 [Blattella germanica]|nr:hypothetical protein C0J52_14295 [Blattella germanica]